ncbi:hypothetical protein SKAU_G00023340 [Synaphobranchus kaupii]|uniref:Uncharacterized protein n=1 Tax=Synaphobranchus kaupii TaxID=118154 RepID=A0A9Q1GC84_SYNKA|nr:hypothetical protein SKAU_G00023340 [Synaphobranchus kaupii]
MLGRERLDIPQELCVEHFGNEGGVATRSTEAVRVTPAGKEVCIVAVGGGGAMLRLLGSGLLPVGARLAFLRSSRPAALYRPQLPSVSHEHQLP